MTNLSPGAPKWGVVLLAHGSQRGATKQECSCAWRGPDNPVWCQECPSTPAGLTEAAHRLQGELGVDEEQLVLSCLEFIQPHPDQALRILDERGIQRVVVAPFLLGQGKHATLELDEVLDDLRAQLPQMQLYLADGLGVDAGLADLVVERVRSLEGADAPGKGNGNGAKGILLVKAGTKSQYDDCLWLEELGSLVEAKLGAGYAVAVAQSHYGDPTMDAAAAKLVEERQVSSIVCVPYLFFPGMILRRNVLGGMDEIEKRYPSVTMSVTPPLGVDERVVNVAAQRVRRVWHTEGNGVN